ncbi:MAG: YncE family protein [Proteobacteria bacterium]|nr:YncE family protein [Pseudomonadota bacterium]
MKRRHLLAAALAAPLSLRAGDAHAWITNQASHSVSVIHVASRQVVATVPVGRSPAGVVALGRRVYVSCPDSRAISVIDTATRQVAQTLPAGQGPVGLAATEDGTVYAADWYANRLLVLGARTDEAALGRAPAGVLVHAGRVYVAERDDDCVAVLDAATLRVQARVPVGSHPFALALDAPRGRLFALNVQSDDASVIDLATLTVTHRLPTGAAPYGAAVSRDGRWLYVTNQHADSVSQFDAHSLAPLRTLDGFGYPEGIAAWGDEIWVVNWMDDAVSVLDAASGRERTRIPVGRNPRGFGPFISLT